MSNPLETRLTDQISELRREGVYKRLNVIESPQAARVRMEGRGEVIILSSNNYLGLSAEPEVIAAGKWGLDQFGAGTASVRFICGTFSIHRELESALAHLVGTDASLSFGSCWNANEALPATVLTEHDLVLSDQLNHASIIDGIRLAKSITKCQTGVYEHRNLTDLDAKLSAARDRQVKMVMTDGVFSMEGAIADLPGLKEVCRKHGAVLVVDDSHSTGVLGKTGRGTAEHFDMLGDVDVITSTLGKALGGAAGGFVAGSEALCDYLTQRGRPQLFSNAPSAFTTRYLGLVESLGIKLHFLPVGNPAPPKPRKFDLLTSAITCSGVISVTALRAAWYPSPRTYAAIVCESFVVKCFESTGSTRFTVPPNMSGSTGSASGLLTSVSMTSAVTGPTYRSLTCITGPASHAHRHSTASSVYAPSALVCPGLRFRRSPMAASAASPPRSAQAILRQTCT